MYPHRPFVTASVSSELIGRPTGQVGLLAANKPNKANICSLCSVSTNEQTEQNV